MSSIFFKITYIVANHFGNDLLCLKLKNCWILINEFRFRLEFNFMAIVFSIFTLLKIQFQNQFFSFSRSDSTFQFAISFIFFLHSSFTSLIISLLLFLTLSVSFLVHIMIFYNPFFPILYFVCCDRNKFYNRHRCTMAAKIQATA